MSAPQDKSPWVNFRPHQFPGVDGIVERQEHPKNRLSDQALSRIAKAYNYCWSIAETKEFSLWGSIIFKRHSLFHEVAKQENLGRLRAMLEWPATNDLFYGFDNLYQEISSTCREGSPELKGYGLVCMDRLVTLAEAVGARRQWHPEADTWADPIQQSPDDVIGSIEKVLGIRLDFPSPFRQAFGLPTARGLVSDRAIHAIYLAFRMVQLSQQPPGRSCFLEIGGGLGRAAYYSHRLGVRQYVIVDIPVTLACAAYFLMCSVGPERIALPGEGGEATAAICLMAPEDFLKHRKNYDVAASVDAITEFALETSRKYLMKVAESSPVMMSINHELNAEMFRDLCLQTRGVLPASRFPYWLRKGYVEEVAMSGDKVVRKVIRARLRPTLRAMAARVPYLLPALRAARRALKSR